MPSNVATTSITMPTTTSSWVTVASSNALRHQGLRSWRSCCASSRQALARLPASVRGRKRHSVSPRRAVAGSSQVAARGWWPR
jgi:hypothetical protein